MLADGFGLADVAAALLLAVAEVAVPLADCSSAAGVLAVPVLLAVVLAAVKARGLGEGSVLGLGDRAVLALGEPAPGGSVVEPLWRGELLLGVPLPALLVAVEDALGVAVLVGVVLLGDVLPVGVVVRLGDAVLVGVDLLGVGVGVVRVGVGVGVGVFVFVGVGVGVGLGGRLSDWHC